MESPTKIIASLLIMTAVISQLVAGCRRETAPVSGDVLVVSVGDSALMLEDVLAQVPRGLEPEDSVAMFRSTVETWLRRQVLMSVAVGNIDNIDEIDRMVEDYRTDLILNRYLALMAESDDNSVSKRSIDRYYREYGDSMLLEEPVVKGIFLKVSENDPALGSLRRWMHDPDDKAVDNLERNGLRGAVQYEYFQDRWHPWHEVAEMVPYRFFDADAFLESTRDFETTYGGSVYLIHISEYVPTGQKMPEEYARQRIAAQLRHNSVVANRDKLISGIYRREMDKGRLHKGIYDPVTGTLEDVKQSSREQLPH